MTSPPASDGVAAALAVLSPLGHRAVVAGPIGPLTTYRVGGAAAVRVTVESEDELYLVAEARAAGNLPVLVVGRGSNLLVADAGFAGLAVVIDPDGFGAIDIPAGSAGSGSGSGPTQVAAGAAVALPVLARQTVEAGLTGFEWAVGVPGSVGGAVRMNAGGHGSDISRTLTSARVFDLGSTVVGEWEPSRLDHGYRHSSIGPGHVVVAARFALAPGDREAGRETIREIVRWRREHQPGGQNAGSVFTNPSGDSAGRLIEACGLKGRRLGTAMVSPKHANFIQADPGGSADDVRRLLLEVRDEVTRQTGIELAHEVRLIGFGPSTSSRDSDPGQDAE